jgi:putative MATE family efflux protein
MLVRVSYESIWKIAYPIMIGSIAQTMLGLTDTAFLARVGEVELGASAIGGVFYFVLAMVGMGFSIGSQIMMSRKAGENNPYSIGRIFDHSILLMITLSVLVFTLVTFSSHFIFSRIITSPLVLSGAGLFIKSRIWGIFFVMIAMSFRAFYTGISQTRIITYSAIVMTVLNVVLDYLLIFGHYGFPEMGITGAGLASAISEAVAALYLIIYTAFKKDIKNFRLFTFEKISNEMFGKITRMSGPIVMQNLISMGAWFAFFVFIERLGVHELAISNIVRSNYMIMMTPVWGFSSAANSMVSNLIGQNKAGEVVSLLKKIITLSLCISVTLVLFNVLFAEWVLHLTAGTERLVHDSLGCFYIVCLASVIFSISMVLFSGVSGTGATKAAMFLEISNIIFYLTFVYLTAVVIHTPVEVVWFAEVLYWLLMGTFSYFYLKSLRWQLITI